MASTLHEARAALAKLCPGQGWRQRVGATLQTLPSGRACANERNSVGVSKKESPSHVCVFVHFLNFHQCTSAPVQGEGLHAIKMCLAQGERAVNAKKNFFNMDVLRTPPFSREHSLDCLKPCLTCSSLLARRLRLRPPGPKVPGSRHRTLRVAGLGSLQALHLWVSPFMQPHVEPRHHTHRAHWR